MTAIEELIAQKGGIRLDIACGSHKQPGFVGIDIQELPGVDIVHDLNVHPWPLPNECAIMAVASHIVEHIPKVSIYQGYDGLMHTWFPLIEFFNDVWRVMKPDGEFAIAVPHGYSPGFQQDPTHASQLNEHLFYYFNPDHPFYEFYRPKPWRTKIINWDPSANMEVVLVKIANGGGQ